MSSAQLIQRLKKGHQAIATAITQIRETVRSYSQAKPFLRILEQAVINHLECQDARFFRQLSTFYAEDREALKMLEFLTFELKELKVKYLVFSDAYPAQHIGDSGRRNFSKDFSEFAEAAIGRIRMENEYLLPLLQRMANGD